MKYMIVVLFLLFSDVCFSGDIENQVKAECDFISILAMNYAKFKYDNDDYPVDSINYKDPVVYALVPFVDMLKESEQEDIGVKEVAMFSQAAIDGEIIYESIKKNGIASKFVSITISALDLACYYRKGLSFDQVKEFR